MGDRLPLDRSPSEIAGMFDDIAGRYDLLNRVLSAGRDRSWRARAVAALDLKTGETALDLCTGTADLALALTLTDDEKAQPRVIAVDFSAEMLKRGYEKVEARATAGAITLLRADAERIPLGDNSVDGVSMGFGIRNVSSPKTALTEIRRVLRPGGRLAILEIGEPRLATVRSLYLWYFRRLLPLIGRVISRHRSAYTYLPASVGTFYTPPAFRALLEEVGFTEVQVTPLTLGIVYLFRATQPSEG